MRKTVLYKQPGGKHYRPTRVHCARRARIPGMPWFKCFTNRWWTPELAVLGVHLYQLIEEQTGLVPAGFSCGSREDITIEAIIRLRRRKRTFILAAIARAKAGHLDKQRIPQHFRHRTR